MASKPRSKWIHEIPSDCGDAGHSEIVVIGENENNEELLELAELYHKNGNNGDARSSIDKVITRLDTEFERYKHNPQLFRQQGAIEVIKDVAEKYKQCCMFLLEKLQLQDRYGMISLSCFYKGLILHGTSSLFDNESVVSDIWEKICIDFRKNSEDYLLTTSDLVKICSDLCTVRSRIVLFVAFEVLGKLMQLLKSCQPSKLATDLQQQIRSLLLTCARCHFYLEEYDKSIEALIKLWPDPYQCKFHEALVMRAWCLFHTQQYHEATRVAGYCMSLRVSDQQRTNLESLLTQIQQKNVQVDRKQFVQVPITNFTTVSGYSYGDNLDLVGNIDFENDTFTDDWPDTESIAASECSTMSESSIISSTSTSSHSTRSRTRKVRRKTKILRKKKGKHTCESDTKSNSSLKLDSLEGNQTNKFDRIRKWTLENKMWKKHGRKWETCHSSGLSFWDIHSEVIYSRETPEDFDDSLSEVTSITSRAATSRANFSPDEFSGSEYDVLESDDDWYMSDTDLDVQSDDEEIPREEPTYYWRSHNYHSGQFVPRNFLENECFQKGLQLDEGHVDKLGGYYFKKGRLVYNDINKGNYDDSLRNPHAKQIFKKCSISIESAHFAICKPLEPNDEIQEIEILGRSKCGMTYTDDTVIVQLYRNRNSGKVHGEVNSHDHNSGKVHGEVKFLVERHRYKGIEHPVFVCLIDLKEGHLMKPLCRTVPKLHVLHSRVAREHNHLKKSRVEVYKYDDVKGTLSFSRYHDVKEGERENLLFVVVFLNWKRNKIYPLAAVVDVIQSSQNPYDGIRIISKEHQVPYLYSKSSVDGVKTMLEAAKSFKTDGHKDRTGLRVFTIDPPGSKDLDDALCIFNQKDGSYIVGVHIADVSSLVMKGDPVDLEAKERCTTFYPGRGFRPFAMLPEPLSCDVFSLLAGKKKPVISVFFKFEKNGKFSKADPYIEKSIIKSCRQLTYQEVQDILDEKKTAVKDVLKEDIKLMYKFSKYLKKDRLGDASFSLPVEIDISEEENPMETYEAHSLVEEFMILTNACIARMLRRRYPACIPLLCQAHPVDEVFNDWYELNKHYLYHVLGLQSLATPEGKILVEDSPSEGRKRKLIPIQKWVLDEVVKLASEDEGFENIAKIKKLICSDFFHPKQALAYNEWLLQQESSRYVCSGEVLDDKEKLRHFSLRKNQYVHFTSPIRRYCDIIIHRLVTAMIQNLPSPYQPQEITELCGKMNDATKRANQFKKDCKQFILGCYLQKHPILFNGFVKEMSDRGIKLIIPGLQKLSSTRKEIKFNTLDVGSKPKMVEDVDMLNMTEREKERGMVVVKWEKRLYSHIHKTCRKPKPSKFDQDRQNFSPHLRIYPHQNTAFLRYREHWKEILMFLLRGQDLKLTQFLTEFKDYDIRIKPKRDESENNKVNKEEEADGSSQANEDLPAVTGGPRNEIHSTILGQTMHDDQNNIHKAEDKNMEHDWKVITEITNTDGQENSLKFDDHTERSGLAGISQHNDQHDKSEKSSTQNDGSNDDMTVKKTTDSGVDATTMKKTTYSGVDETTVKKTTYSKVVDTMVKMTTGCGVDDTKEKKTTDSGVDNKEVKKTTDSGVDETTVKKTTYSKVVDTMVKKTTGCGVDDTKDKKTTDSDVDDDVIPLLPPLPEFTEGLQYGQIQRNYWVDKNTLSSSKRSVIDVSSEVRQGIIVEHRCKFQVPYHHGQVVQVQLSADINRGFLTPKPQVLNITDNVKFCIDHFNNPVKTLLRYAKNPSKDRYKCVKDYIRTWIPIVEMESAVNAVQSEDTAVINDITMDFKGRRGRFKLTRGYCDIRDLDLNVSEVSDRISSVLEMKESDPGHAEGGVGENVQVTAVEQLSSRISPVLEMKESDPGHAEGGVGENVQVTAVEQLYSRISPAQNGFGHVEGYVGEKQLSSWISPTMEMKQGDSGHIEDNVVENDCNDIDSVYSLCEELHDIAVQNIDTKSNLSENEISRNAEGSHHSSNDKKPEYTEILSSHFLCIKLMQPLPDRVKAKVGNCMPKDSKYIWVAHGSLIKSRQIRTKKFSQRRGTEKKVLELDMVFKLHENSPPPPVARVTSDDKCSLELIMKCKVLRRIENYIKMLPQASCLARNIALKKDIEIMDRDHLSLCEQVGYEIDVPDFPPNNQQQQIAIRKALRSRFSLIQGPPGTGKSFTGVKLIYLLTKFNKMYEEKSGHRRKLIFCGPSNKSVDLVARWVVNKLKDKAPKIVRMYASALETKDFPVPGRVSFSSRTLRDSKTDAELKDKGFVLHHIIRQDGKPHASELQKYDAKFEADNLIITENEKVPHEERRPVETKLEDIYGYKRILNEATMEELEKYDVIFCTTSMAASPRLIQVTKGKVAQVIIDECGMCSEPETMVPIIATHATQIVLIGDHKQLRPIISCREAAELGLEKSLFERYSTDKELMTMLEEQYRMHPSICEFPSEQFYGGKLKTAAGIGTSHQPLKMWPKTAKKDPKTKKQEHIPHVFCHIEGEEEILTVRTKEGNEQSRSNLKEIEQVLKVFKYMTEVEGVDPLNINIMSQYNSQCTELRTRLKELGKERFNVTTVVSSQGGEWDYVIFSLVRSLPKYLIEKNATEGWCIQNLGFITDRHQINVALTRARKGLVIIGNSNLLECDEVWKKLLEDYKQENCYFNARNFPKTRSVFME